MTDPQFIAGIVAGLLFASVLIAVYGLITRPRRREPVEWTDDHYRAPVITHVATPSINRIREINL